jgi:hypothetical protein
MPGHTTDPDANRAETGPDSVHSPERVADRVARQVADGGQLLELVNATPGASLSRQLGEACRQFPERLLVWQIHDEADERLPAEVFYAFGFRQLFSCLEGRRHHVLHEYRLSEYKAPPDWLNSRYWANPERFNADPDEVRQLPAMDDDPVDSR